MEYVASTGAALWVIGVPLPRMRISTLCKVLYISAINTELCILRHRDDALREARHVYICTHAMLILLAWSARSDHVVSASIWRVFTVRYIRCDMHLCMLSRRRP